MTIKEAFEILKRYEAELSITKQTEVSYDDVISARYEISKLVERDTPMKVIKTQNWSYHCPRCKDEIDVSNVGFDTKQVYRYCYYCGQRLDWSKL
jgi:DNA-directed RNA polymerase subunit RPC12/RpoP